MVTADDKPLNQHQAINSIILFYIKNMLIIFVLNHLPWKYDDLVNEKLILI